MIPPRLHRPVLAVAAAALVLSTAPAYGAVPDPPPTAVTLAPGGIPASQQETNGYDFTPNGEALSTAATLDVAPGLKMTNFQRLETTGWNRGNVLTADLSTSTLSMDVQNTGKVAGVGTLSNQMKGTGAVAGVNGDFFDMNGTGAPVGIAQSREGLLNAPDTAENSFAIADGKALIDQLTAAGTMTVAGTEHQLDGFNTPELPTDGIGVYNSLWGDYNLNRPVGGPDDIADKVARATVVDGVVTAVDDQAGAPEIPDGGQVILARDAGADAVGALSVGDHVDISVALDQEVDMALSGRDQLVIDGEPNPDLENTDDGVHSRTAIGVSEDGSKVILLALDGQTTASRGMTKAELGGFMSELGAYQAVNLDGGGSTTMAARVAGDTQPRIVDTPSDGHEREVSNTLLFYSDAQSSTAGASGAQIRPATNRSGAYHVLQGQRRTLFGSGLDANLAAVEQGGKFSTQGRTLRLGATSGSRTTVTGLREGEGIASFDLKNGRNASMPLTVLGKLEHLGIDKPVVHLPDENGSDRVMLTGYDADGRPAPIEPSEVTVNAEPGVKVEPDGANGFTLTPTMADGAAGVTFTVGDHTVASTVLVGQKEQTVADFSNGADWTFGSDRATGTVAAVPGGGPNGEDALRLQYDFTQSTATRGGYAVPPAPIKITGQPRSVTLWIKGDSSGVWPRIEYLSGDGTKANLDGDNVTWDGWQQVTFEVPDGTAMPITINRIRFLEILPDASYQGDISIANLVANIPPDADIPTPETVQDPVILTNGTVDDRPQRIAVMSDGQFVARNPDSDLVKSVRATLREIVAAEPDHLIIDGDFVDEASPEDMAFAKQIIDEEVGDAVPYTYVPGNHEVMGGAIDNFKNVFGPTHTEFKLGSTQVITLNSSSLTLHGNDDGIAQLTALQEQLDAAADDPSVTGVIVATHVPINDPLVDKASQLTDRIEAQQLEDLLGRFRAGSGKQVTLMNGHVGVFHAASGQGVSQIINGNSGKTPAGNAGHGGFRGWTMLGIDPSQGDTRLGWLRAETRPAVDSLTLNAPDTLKAGESVTLDPTIAQGEAQIPVAWPMSAVWTGDGVSIGDEVGRGVARFDPATRKLTGVSEGSGTLTLTVNGVKQSVDVTVR